MSHYLKHYHAATAVSFASTIRLRLTQVVPVSRVLGSTPLASSWDLGPPLIAGTRTAAAEIKEVGMTPASTHLTIHAVLSAQLTLTPESGSLPGGAALQSLLNGLAWWALLACLVGLIVGAATWALGAHSNNYQGATTGRRAVLVSGAAALLIGAAPTLLNFLFGVGQSVK